MTNTPRNIARGSAGAAGGLLGALAGTIGGWLAYSALAVEHDVPLPPAIQAERRVVTAPVAGELSYYADEHGAGRPLVLIHSINAGGSAYEMRPLFEAFRGRRPVYALDLPGFGFSERSERDYTPELYVRAIVEFLESEVPGVGETDVVAFSLSGEFAAVAALERPDLFATLVLLSPTGFTQRGDENRSQRSGARGSSERALRLLSFPLWSQGLYDLLVTRPSIRYFYGRNFVGEVDSGLEAYAYMSTHRPGARWAPLAFVSGKLFRSDIRESVYQQLRLPVLVIYDRDPNVSFDTLPETLSSCANWRSERVAPTLGLPQFEQTDQTVEALERFWTANSLATGTRKPAEAG